jgi:NAD(P)-dependent dehydrogenase (short-subunit alcohol dehydrogenase family)
LYYACEIPVDSKCARMAVYKAIVTGGARGIGYALTAALLEAGGKVSGFSS